MLKRTEPTRRSRVHISSPGISATNSRRAEAVQWPEQLGSVIAAHYPLPDGGSMRGKRIKDKLATGRPVFYTGLSFHAPRLVELLARSGIDLLFLDAEHGPLSEA